MFTGLIEQVGTIVALESRDGGLDLTVDATWGDLAAGESVAVNGACLTVAALGAGWFRVHLVPTSLARTAFGDRRAGDRVNLERALRVGDRLGGHLVQGHVDGVGEVASTAQGADDLRLIVVRMPADVADVTIPLGSITVDGVSLTANRLLPEGAVELAIVPFTLEHTTLGSLSAGDRVHLEGDLVGKHVRALAARWPGAAGTG